MGITVLHQGMMHLKTLSAEDSVERLVFWVLLSEGCDNAVCGAHGMLCSCLQPCVYPEAFKPDGIFLK